MAPDISAPAPATDQWFLHEGEHDNNSNVKITTKIGVESVVDSAIVLFLDGMRV